MIATNNPSNPIPRAVVVDDDLTQAKILSALLEKAGIQPTLYCAAETALDCMAQDAPPALIITDLYMPGIDGWRFCRLLRSPEYARYNKVPILVVSSTFSGDEIARVTSELGANAFLPMPVDGQVFSNQVQALVGGGKAQEVLNVLVVEDSKLISKRLTEAFQAHGYRADAAFTYQDGLARIGQTAYDAAVLDYHLPDGLGDALLRQLHAKTPDCACIMITSDPQPELALEWMKMGAAAYLQKPLDPKYLIAQCERARRERALIRIQDLLEERNRQLRESEEKFSKVFTNAPVWISITDMNDASYVEVNEQALRENGFTREEVVGHTAVEIGWIKAEDRARLVQEIREHGRIYGLEMEFQSKDGKALRGWVKGEQVIIGSRSCLLTVTLDITERKQIEESLRISEGRYRAFFEQGPDGVVILDPDSGQILEFNDQVCNQLGYTREEMSKLNVADIEIVESAEQVQRHIKKVMTEGRDDFETLHRTKTGKIRNVRVTAHVINAGSHLIYHCIWRDITEGMRMEEDLRENERVLSTLISNLPGFVYRCKNDHNWSMTFISDGCTEITGYTPEDFLHNKKLAYNDIVHPDFQEPLWQKLQVLLPQRKPFEEEYPIITASGATRWVWERGQGVFSEDGQLLYLEGFITDVTESKLAKEKLSEQVEELRRWYAITLGREDRILELKREINRLLTEAGKPSRYPSAQETEY